MSIVLAMAAMQVAGAVPAGVPASAPAGAEVAHGAAAGPPTPPTPKPKVPETLKPAGCSTSLPTDPGVVVVCAPTPEGYRIDPDVIRARQLAHNHVLPKRREMLHDNSCQVVGSMGCMNAGGINVVGAALTAVKLVQTAVAGGNVMKLLQTNPEPSEYELYLAAKADREESEREAAANAAAVAGKAKHGAALAP